MKYLIGNVVINAEQIVKVAFFQPGQSMDGDGLSHCGIELVGATDGWSIWLSGDEAEMFWDVYSKDAYRVF